MVSCILAIGPYTNPKTHKLNYAHRQTNKTYKHQTDKQITTVKQTKNKQKGEADRTVTAR